MARNCVPGNVWRAVYEPMDIEEGNPPQLVDPEVTTPLGPMSEPAKENDKWPTHQSAWYVDPTHAPSVG